MRIAESRKAQRNLHACHAKENELGSPGCDIDFD